MNTCVVCKLGFCLRSKRLGPSCPSSFDFWGNTCKVGVGWSPPTRKVQLSSVGNSWTRAIRQRYPAPERSVTYQLHMRPNLHEAQRSRKPISLIHATWTQGQAWALQAMQVSSASSGKGRSKSQNNSSSLNVHVLYFRGDNHSPLGLKEGSLP